MAQAESPSSGGSQLQAASGGAAAAHPHPRPQDLGAAPWPSGAKEGAFGPGSQSLLPLHTHCEHRCHAMWLILRLGSTTCVQGNTALPA